MAITVSIEGIINDVIGPVGPDNPDIFLHLVLDPNANITPHAQITFGPQGDTVTAGAGPIDVDLEIPPLGINSQLPIHVGQITSKLPTATLTGALWQAVNKQTTVLETAAAAQSSSVSGSALDLSGLSPSGGLPALQPVTQSLGSALDPSQASSSTGAVAFADNTLVTLVNITNHGH